MIQGNRMNCNRPFAPPLRGGKSWVCCFPRIALRSIRGYFRFSLREKLPHTTGERTKRDQVHERESFMRLPLSMIYSFFSAEKRKLSCRARVQNNSKGRFRIRGGPFCYRALAVIWNGSRRLCRRRESDRPAGGSNRSSTLRAVQPDRLAPAR